VLFTTTHDAMLYVTWGPVEQLVATVASKREICLIG
jgi:hypothetical protein